MKRTSLVALSAIAALGLMMTAAFAATTVSEADLGDTWFDDASAAGGTVTWTFEHGAPAGFGDYALELSTIDDDASKANLAHPVEPVAVGDVTELGYWTYQAEGPDPASASLQLFVTFDDDEWTWLVYEPYWQNDGTPDSAPVQPETWQEWDDIADEGLFWSSQNAGGLQAGAGGPPLHTLDDVVDSDDSATVEAIAVNVGTYNPGWTVAVDGLAFQDRVFDFEADKNNCKKGGWQTMTDPGGGEFHNQGDCVSHFASGGKSRGPKH